MKSHPLVSLLLALAVYSGLAAPSAGRAAPAVPPPEVLARMFAVPGLPSAPEAIDWTRLPTLPVRTSVVVRGVQNESAFMHHPFVVVHAGRVFALWNDGYIGEDFAGQRVRYATSRDGLAWDPPVDLTGRETRRRYTACGFWRRGGEMYALAALRDASDGGKTGEDPLLLAFPYDAATGKFGGRRVIARDFFAQNIPALTPAGDWLILGKGGTGSWGPMKSAKGGVKAIDDWTVRDLPGAGRLEEAEWYALPNGHLVAHFRTRTPKRLMRMYSVDHGLTWTDPVVTDFPEAGARHHGLRLSNGLYALLVNPNPQSRIPFAIATSRDGLVYDRIANVRPEPTKARWEGRAKSAGYHYMRGYEHDGQLYTIYSVNKEDIEVSIVALSDLSALHR